VRRVRQNHTSYARHESERYGSRLSQSFGTVSSVPAASCCFTTVAGLLTHIAEHTQRHVGQAISAAKLSRVEGKDTGPA